MEDTQTLGQFILAHSDKLLEQTLQHISLTFLSLFISVLIGLPLGVFISRKKIFAKPVLGFAGILQTIPSIALLGFMIPLLGIGPKSAIIALLLYALLPIIRNTFTGINGVSEEITEAAKGLGMTNMQVLFKVELPLAMPVIFAGIRTATVINVGVATLAAYIAAGGLGEFIFGGIALNNSNMILAGAIPAALLAIAFDFLLGKIQKVNFRKFRVAHFSFFLLPLLLSSFYTIPNSYNTGLQAGFTPEFIGRADGYPGLKNKYGLNIRNVVISDAVMYKATYEKELDVISGYSTDGRLKAFDLTTLIDDKNVFPPYYAAPVIRNETLLKYPELENVLELLSNRISDSVMTDLNYKADYLHQDPEKIAKDFLLANLLWREPRNGKKGTIRIGSKIFAEQYILSNMYAMLIKGYTDLNVATKTGLGGTNIVFEALINDQIDMYPEYTGTGLLVILKPKEKIIDSLITSREKVFDFVSKSFKDRYNLKWLSPIGFNNTYALMMRRTQARQLHINSITDLVGYLKNERK
ncbi:osmoprotectant transport system permease protein [Pedobacter sp. ok626]|uniref:ABC transporter permease/substrate-binding protein n=1 Tax=Pedobacter sp. ok626 TaxID=1761882 RepID=UPI000885B539|nr:ABC transporter permease/substrate-binding protein [Pedobacter sp. ok626]SDK93796.1 osmoprotectant transport system permease protein [Pedobacter sp. ok626]